MPSGHGELVTRPPLEEWATIARRNADAASSWDFDVGGVAARELRENARGALLETAVNATKRMGIGTAEPAQAPVIVTGHQPELYHAGVWVKDFLLQRMAEETGGVGIDLVVDTDSFDWVGVMAPCLDPRVTRCRQYIAVGRRDSCYACAPVPPSDHLEAFCGSTSALLETLPAPAIARHFSRFCEALRTASPTSRSLAELVTVARRQYEGGLTDYLELPVTEMASSEPYLRFAVDILLDAERFAGVYNAELAEYRTLNRIRTAAQPFPDLTTDGDAIEVPFWLLRPEKRVPAFVRSVADGVELTGPDGVVTPLPRDPGQAVAALAACGTLLAPKAVALTLFVRAFLADLFIHGIGGDRYDRVTDAVSERWWGVRLPPYVVASLTMYLPLGAEVVSDEDIAEIDRRLHRLAHNPDESLGEIEFDSPEERAAALALAARKRDLVARISRPDADRRALGISIRAVNDELAGLLEPVAEELRGRRSRLERQRSASEVLTDRTYPFCLWSPAEIADTVL